MVIDSFEFDMSYSVKSIAPFYFTEKKFSLNSKESQNLNVSLLVCKKINPFLSKGVRPIVWALKARCVGIETKLREGQFTLGIIIVAIDLMP